MVRARPLIAIAIEEILITQVSDAFLAPVYGFVAQAFVVIEFVRS